MRAGRGEGHPMGRARHQLRADPGFQRLDAAAERRLRQARLFGTASESPPGVRAVGQGPLRRMRRGASRRPHSRRLLLNGTFVLPQHPYRPSEKDCLEGVHFGAYSPTLAVGISGRSSQRPSAQATRYLFEGDKAMAANAIAVMSPEGGLSRYLTEIRKFPMLARDEEFMLAKAWQEHEDPKAAH
eukprot:gene66968-91715_t